MFSLADIRRVVAQEPKTVPNEIGQWAAVAIMLRELHEGPEVFLIRRTEQEHDPWSGHVAFPGGRYDVHDSDLEVTARRETREEVGIDLVQSGIMLGRLDDVQAVARGRKLPMAIRPYVYEVTQSTAIELEAREVAEGFWAPLSPMLQGRLDTVRRYQLEGREIELPAYDVNGRIVWGLTYHMLRSLLIRLG